MSSSNCCFLTCRQISQEAGKTVWYSHVFKEFFRVCCGPQQRQRLWCSQWSRSRCFSGTLLLFYDALDVGNFISGSSAFSKSNLSIWKFIVHILLKPSREFWALLCYCVRWVQLWGTLNILWHCLSLRLEWKLTFSSPVSGHCWVFQICWHIECSTFRESSFRIWSSSTGIPSSPLALFEVMLPKALLTSHSRMSGSR